MAYNGSGTFLINTAGQPVVPNTVISATAFNALTNDLANGLSTCITKDGQTTPTANIPMGNNKITGLAPGTSGTDAANLSQVQGSTAKLLQSVTGTDTITAAMVPALTSYSAGQMFYFVAAGDNTGAVTINIDSLGAKSVTRDGSTALVSGDIVSGEVALIVYDGTRFQLLNGNSFTNLNVSGTLAVGSTSTFTGAATFSAGTANQVQYLNASKVLTGSANLTFDGTTLTANALTLTNNPTLSGGTANGVLYLNGSKVATSGSALVFDGTNLGIGTASPSSKLDVRGANSNNLSDLSNQIGTTIDTTAYAQNNGGGIGFGYVFNSSGSIIARAAVIKAVKENATDGNYATSLVFANAANSSNTIEKMRLDSSGSLGLGVTPSAWGSGIKSQQIGNYTALTNSQGGFTWLSNNAFYDTAWKYLTTNRALYYAQDTGDGGHKWFNAASGTAGNTISFTQALTLDADGELGIGITSPTARVHAYSTTAMKQLTVDGAGAIKTGVNFASGGTTYGQIYFDNNSPYDMSVVQQYTTGSLIFGTNSTERARITSTGNVVAGGSVALATTATDGFLYVPTCAGTPTGTPTAITGMAPIVVNTTNNKLYFYSGGAWRDAGP